MATLTQVRETNLFAAEMIGLITGGRSGERDRSLLSGETVGEALDRHGMKHVRLDPADAGFADRIRDVDVAFLAIAGQWAEDGKLQGLAGHSRHSLHRFGGAGQRSGDAQADGQGAGLCSRGDGSAARPGARRRRPGRRGTGHLPRTRDAGNPQTQLRRRLDRRPGRPRYRSASHCPGR